MENAGTALPTPDYNQIRNAGPTPVQPLKEIKSMELVQIVHPTQKD